MSSVVLLSGGLDSTTVLALAALDHRDLHALSFRYGQRHTEELTAAEHVAQAYHVRDHVIVDLDLRLWGGSALTERDTAVPKDREPDAMTADIPPTYVPARNTIFLACALSYAEAIRADSIFIGVNALDYSGYPDCRPAFIDAFRTLASLATREGVEGRPIAIHAPLVNLTKTEIIQLGTRLGVNYGLTHSCYDPVEGSACGRCDSCRLRRDGFAGAGVADPTRYAA